MRGLAGGEGLAALLRAGGPPRPSGTPPEGGELCRGRDFPRGKRDGMGERNGLERDPERPPLNSPPSGGGRGWSRTASTNRESIPGKKMHLPGWSRTGLPNEEKMTGKTTENAGAAAGVVEGTVTHA